MSKNGAADSILVKAKREIEERKKQQAEGTGTSKPSDKKNDAFEEDPPEAREQSPVDAELAALMAKIKPTAEYNKVRNYNNIVVGYDSFLLTLHKSTVPLLETKPSCSDGLSSEDEEDLRFLGVELIETMVHLMRLPMTVGEAASIFFQRFFGLKSFVKFNMEHVVMACVLLATKVEECERRPREIITVFDYVKKKFLHRENKSVKVDVMDIDMNYVILKNHVITAERRLLCTLGFVCQLKHPHGYIYVFLKTLGLLDHSVILNTAWACMNDCMRTDLFLRYFPKTIAAACVVRTCRNANPEIILPNYKGFPWYEVYSISNRDVEQIIVLLDRMYARTTKPDWTALMKTVAEARKRKFGAEKVETITEEEAKMSINSEDSKTGDQNGAAKDYAKKLAGEKPARGGNDEGRRKRRSRSRSPLPKRADGDRDRQRDRDRDRERERRHRDRSPRGRGRKRSRSRDRDRRGADDKGRSNSSKNVRQVRRSRSPRRR